MTKINSKKPTLPIDCWAIRIIGAKAKTVA
jgi:hypothetical protein